MEARRRSTCVHRRAHQRLRDDLRASRRRRAGARSRNVGADKCSYLIQLHSCCGPARGCRPPTLRWAAHVRERARASPTPDADRHRAWRVIEERICTHHWPAPVTVAKLLRHVKREFEDHDKRVGRADAATKPGVPSKTRANEKHHGFPATSSAGRVPSGCHGSQPSRGSTRAATKQGCPQRRKPSQTARAQPNV